MTSDSLLLVDNKGNEVILRIDDDNNIISFDDPICALVSEALTNAVDRFDEATVNFLGRWMALYLNNKTQMAIKWEDTIKEFINKKNKRAGAGARHRKRSKAK